ncbi:hypothetical protein DFH27DRAFT_296331 [Peziza echinospora]|nr:hypothetical protein DFH27DRAFT_296331 [Peziza echinospora]
MLRTCFPLSASRHVPTDVWKMAVCLLLWLVVSSPSKWKFSQIHQGLGHPIIFDHNETRTIGRQLFTRRVLFTSTSKTTWMK